MTSMPTSLDRKKASRMPSVWQGWVNQILGVWLSIAPFVSLDISSVKLNNLFVGVLAAIVSGYTPAKKLWECWLGFAAGVWLAISSSIQFFVQGEGYLWNNIIAGALIFTSGMLVAVSEPVGKRAI